MKKVTDAEYEKLKNLEIFESQMEMSLGEYLEIIHDAKQVFAIAIETLKDKGIISQEYFEEVCKNSSRLVLKKFHPDLYKEHFSELNG